MFELEVGTGLLVEAEKRDLGEDVACLEVRRGGACVSGAHVLALGGMARGCWWRRGRGVWSRDVECQEGSWCTSVGNNSGVVCMSRCVVDAAREKANSP